MTDHILHFTFRRFVENLKKGQAAESSISISVDELYTRDSILPIVLNLTFLLLLVLLMMVGLGIMLWAYRTVDSETGSNSCQSTKLSASETMLVNQYDSETGLSSCHSTKLSASETLLFHQYDFETGLISCQ